MCRNNSPAYRLFGQITRGHGVTSNTFDLIFIIALLICKYEGKCYGPHFTGEKTESQTCSRAQKWGNPLDVAPFSMVYSSFKNGDKHWKPEVLFWLQGFPSVSGVVGKVGDWWLGSLLAELPGPC